MACLVAERTRRDGSFGFTIDPSAPADEGGSDVLPIAIGAVSLLAVTVVVALLLRRRMAGERSNARKPR